MSPRRRILRAEWLRAAMCWLIAVYIKLVRATSRFETIGADAPRRYWDEGKPFILAFWHGRLLLAPLAWREGASMNMLISSHADGRLIAGAIRHFGLGTVVGSRSKGGSGALRAMLRALASGENVGVTPDGPRGPLMRASPGIIAAARLSGAPVIPLSYATSHRRLLRSWDRFHLALPFSRGVFLWGEPLNVARDASDSDMEAARIALEQRLVELTAQADRQCGHRPIEAAP